MPQVKTSSPITHLPTSPLTASQLTVQVPVTANNAQKSVPAVSPGLRSLTIGANTVKIDPTSHTCSNVVDIINNANINGVKASLDRYGNLVIDGAAAVGGDASLLQQLGF